MSVLCIIMPPGVAPVYNCIESWAKYEELSIASIFKKNRTIVLKSTCAAGERFNAAPFVINELRIVGSRCGPFAPALKLLGRQDFRPQKYLTKTFPLADAVQALKFAGERS